MRLLIDLLKIYMSSFGIFYLTHCRMLQYHNILSHIQNDLLDNKGKLEALTEHVAHLYEQLWHIVFDPLSNVAVS